VRAKANLNRIEDKGMDAFTVQTGSLTNLGKAVELDYLIDATSSAVADAFHTTPRSDSPVIRPP
jgi:hypothetical protein